MITKFKLFETVNIDEPKVGDYVICSEIADVVFYKNEDWYNDYIELINILKDKIGKIVIIDELSYLVEYKDVPKKLRQDFFVHNDKKQLVCRRFAREDIVFWSKNKKDLSNIDLLRKSKKYNI
jgi:hypothetical protein